jgi:hypothetical protein
MIFSPSLLGPKLKIKNQGNTADTKIYLYAGGDESETMIDQVQKFKIK